MPRALLQAVSRALVRAGAVDSAAVVDASRVAWEDVRVAAATRLEVSLEVEGAVYRFASDGEPEWRPLEEALPAAQVGGRRGGVGGGDSLGSLFVELGLAVTVCAHTQRCCCCCCCCCCCYPSTCRRAGCFRGAAGRSWRRTGSRPSPAARPSSRPLPSPAPWSCSSPRPPTASPCACPTTQTWGLAAAP